MVCLLFSPFLMSALLASRETFGELKNVFEPRLMISPFKSMCRYEFKRPRFHIRTLLCLTTCTAVTIMVFEWFSILDWFECIFYPWFENTFFSLPTIIFLTMAYLVWIALNSLLEPYVARVYPAQICMTGSAKDDVDDGNRTSDEDD